MFVISVFQQLHLIFQKLRMSKSFYAGLCIAVTLSTAPGMFFPLEARAATFSKSKFTPHIKDNFKFEMESVVVEIQLIEVTDHSNVQMESFSLLFRSSERHIFKQNTYKLEHGQLGKLHLFLVPAGQDDQGAYYEAVFTRPIRQQEADHKP
jgi:hypothetical protein